MFTQLGYKIKKMQRTMKLLKSADCWDWNSNCPVCLSLLISSWAWTRTGSASHCAPEVSSTPYAAVVVFKHFFGR